MSPIFDALEKQYSNPKHLIEYLAFSRTAMRGEQYMDLVIKKNFSAMQRT